MCKLEGKMKQDLYLNILRDELMYTIKLYHFNPLHVIFKHDNDPKHIANQSNIGYQCKMLMCLLGPLNHLT